MNEDAPNFDQQQSAEQENPNDLNQTGEQPPAESQSAPETSSSEGAQETGDSEEPIHLTTVDHSDEGPREGEENRWDFDKAYAMADVLDKTPIKKEIIEESKQRRDELLSQGREGYIENDDSVKSELENPDPFAPNLIDEYKEQASERYDEELHANSNETVNWETDRLLMPYQELYDLNPGRFASMPTSEFIVSVQKLEELDRKIHRYDSEIKAISGRETRFSELIEKEYLIGGEETHHLKNQYRSWLYPISENRKTYNERLEKFDSIAADSYNKSPRQIMEGYVELFRSVKSELEALTEEPKWQKQELLDSFKPKSGPDNPEPQAESQPEGTQQTEAA